MTQTLPGVQSVLEASELVTKSVLKPSFVPGLTQCSERVHVSLGADNLNIQMPEYVQHYGAEPAVACDAVERRYENHADLAVFAIAEQTPKRGPIGSHPAHAFVDIQPLDNEATVFRQPPQHLLLLYNRRRAVFGNGCRPAITSYDLIFFHIPQGMTQPLP